MKKNINIVLMIIGFIIVTSPLLQAQKPYRIGTTSANFLELGFGGAAQAETFQEALISTYKTNPRLKAERARVKEACNRLNEAFKDLQ